MYKHFINFIVFLPFLFVGGCKNSAENELNKAANGEGMITYRITYPENSSNKNIHILPNTTNLFFKDSRASFITSVLGMAQMVNLLDNDHKKYTSLLINSIGKNYAFTDTPEDVKQQESTPQFKIEPTGDTKVIAGVECRKAVVNDLTNNKKFNIYFCDKTKVYLGNSPYKDFNYLLMEYDDEKYGLSMHLQATKVHLGRIDTAMLSVHGDFNWVDKKTFISIVKSLSDL